MPIAKDPLISASENFAGVFSSFPHAPLVRAHVSLANFPICQESTFGLVFTKVTPLTYLVTAFSCCR